MDNIARKRKYRKSLNACIDEMTSDCRSVVEYGCMFGDRLATLKTPEYKVGIEVHRPYLQVAKSRNPNAIYICADVLEFITQHFSFVGVDAIMMLDFLEHLRLEDALKVIDHAKKTARARVIVFVPAGNHPQESDPYRMGGDYWQTHRSTWNGDMLLELDFDAVHLPKFHRRNGTYVGDGAVFATWEP